MSRTTNHEMEQFPLHRKLGIYNEPPLPEQAKKKTLWQSLKDTYFEFCSNTSLHGVQYFGQRRPWKEILFWILVFIVSIYFCSKTIHSVYRKWEDTPVIVTFSERSIPVSSIPFPAITICSETKNARTKSLYGELINHLDKGLGLPSNLTSDDLNEFLTLLHTCQSEPSNYTHFHNTVYEPIDYFNVLDSIAYNFSNMYLVCSWARNLGSIGCDQLFTPTYTDEGLCHTFNGFNATDLFRNDTVQYQVMGLDNHVDMTTTAINRTLTWSLEKGYPPRTPLNTYPARVVSASTKASLKVYLAFQEHMLDYGCGGPIQGFKVAVHTPDDVPVMSKRFVRLSLNKAVTLVAKPVMVTTSGSIADYKPEKRKCYLAGERELRFFKVYSEKNCELECLTNFTLHHCGCVKFSMPRTPDMPVCAADKIECYKSAEEYLLLENFADGDDDDDGCNCMPSCTSLEYDTEISQADVDVKQFFEALNMMEDELEGLTISFLEVYFKDNEFITSKRGELFGLTDFLANCGGVLGLFMGFSFLSVVEMLYHLTLRLWSNMKRKRDMN